jgi:8-oxo-dGTP diphosphatase
VQLSETQSHSSITGTKTPLQVAVGVIKNASGHVLLSLRPDNLHQGGLWEFPGGKVEAFESVEQALIRELNEELSINVRSFYPLITVNHDYPDRSVRLQVFVVTDFSGEAKGCQGQEVNWVAVDKLYRYDFPAANRPIITAAQLPSYYAILDGTDENSLIDRLKYILNQDIKLIQARLKDLPLTAITGFLQLAYPLCQQHQALLMLNSAYLFTDMLVDGFHLSSSQLMALNKRPSGLKWLAASCHNCDELRHAETIGVDFVVLAPVKSTPTHPDVKPLGWGRFAALVDQVNVPVYALGGLSLVDLHQAQECGAQGIAAIRAFLG